MKLTVEPTLIDLKNDPLYKADIQPTLVEVPEMPFVAVDGVGAPTSEEGESDFQQALQVLFTIIYTIKFWDKKHTAPEGYAKFSMPPLEAMWWSEQGDPFGTSDTSAWHWRAMLRVPDFVDEAFFREVLQEVMAQKADKAFQLAHFERIKEGPALQILHVGPYDEEKRSVDALLEYSKRESLTVDGKHHELYFSDPRRTAPDKLKTIIRYPVKSRR